jgi:hypothetical protein
LKTKKQTQVSLGFRGFRTCFWEVDHPLCDVYNNLIGAQVFGKGKIYKPTWTKTSLRLVFGLRWKKTQILIEFLDGTKKVQLFAKKSSPRV